VAAPAAASSLRRLIWNGGGEEDVGTDSSFDRVIRAASPVAAGVAAVSDLRMAGSAVLFFGERVRAGRGTRRDGKKAVVLAPPHMRQRPATGPASVSAGL
jgi:hypothetical protein